jgi:hypothetical protein
MARARAAHEAHLAATVEVRPWKGDKFAKPVRVPKEESNAWQKSGDLVLEERPDVRGSNFDDDFGPTMSIRTKAIGTELPEGTIKGKRMIVLPDAADGKLRKRVQYLVRPRGKKAETDYQRGLRIAEIRYQLGAGIDYLDGEAIQRLRAELERLTAKK